MRLALLGFLRVPRASIAAGFLRMCGLALLMGWAQGCSVAEGEDSFTLEIATTVEIPAGGPTDSALLEFPVLGGLTELDLSRTSAFESRGYLPEDVKQVTVTSVKLSALGPPGQDLNFLGEVRVLVDTEGVPTKLLARADDFPPGTERVQMEASTDNVMAWLIGLPGRIHVVALASQRPARATQVELRFKFDLVVRVY